MIYCLQWLMQQANHQFLHLFASYNPTVHNSSDIMYIMHPLLLFIILFTHVPTIYLYSTFVKSVGSETAIAVFGIFVVETNQMHQPRFQIQHEKAVVLFNTYIDFFLPLIFIVEILVNAYLHTIIANLQSSLNNNKTTRRE